MAECSEIGTAKMKANLIRNGSFEITDTGWAKNQWTSRFDAINGTGMRINPFQAQNNQGFIMQELHLPSKVESGAFSFDYCFQVGQGVNPSLGGFFASIITFQGDILANLFRVDINSFPGYNWQNARANLDGQSLSLINSAHESKKRVFLLMALAGSYIEVIVDNIKLEIEGTMALPSLSGKIAYTRNGKEICLISPYASEQKTIWTTPAPIGNIYDVAWRPGKDVLAFSSNHEFGFSRWASDIYTINSDGSGIKRLTNQPSQNEMDSMNYPTGTVTGKIHNRTDRIISVIVYVQGAKNFARMSSAIISQNRDVGDTESFSIDVYDLGANVGQHVVVWEEGCSESEIAVDVIAGQTVDVGTIDYDGHRVKRDAGQINWCADGSMLGFELAPNLLRMIPADAGFASMDVPLLDLNIFTSYPAWFQQGQRLLYVQKIPSEKEGIYLTNAGTANEGIRIASFQEIASTSDYPIWLPDGSGFLFVGRRSKSGIIGGNIYHYDLNSNQVNPLTDFWNESAGYLSLSPDGEYIVFERQTQEGQSRDIWIMKRTDPTVMWQLTYDGQSGNPSWGSGQTN